MFRIVAVLLLIWMPFNGLLAQQKDSVFLQLTLDTIHHEIQVQQEFRLHNRSSTTLKSIQFHAWANAYSGRATVLNQTKLEDRKGKLYFSTQEERGGVLALEILDSAQNALLFHSKKREFIQVALNEPWRENETIQLFAQYRVKIPTDEITRYGKNKNGDYLLKYFFLEAALIDENNQWILQHFKDFEGVASAPKTYVVQLNLPENYQAFGDLVKTDNTWIGHDLAHFELFLTKKTEQVHTFQESDKSIVFGFAMDQNEQAIIDSLIPQQWTFLENHLGPLREPHLFISSKTKREQNFFGVDDLDAWIMQIQLFSDPEKNAFKLMQWLSDAYIDRLLVVNKINDHWLKNGLQYYLMMQYVDEKFPETQLIGDLSDKISWLGIAPLKLFHFSKLDLNQRYSLLYLYMARQNYDQAINTPLDEMSNMNQIAMSGFKTAMTFRFMAEYLGEEEFQTLFRNWLQMNQGKLVNPTDFQHYLAEHTTQDFTWFFEDFIHKKDKINFKLLRMDEDETQLSVKVKNTTQFSGPFQLVGLKDGQVVEKQWYTAKEKKKRYSFPKGDYDKIVLNPDHLFPEFNQSDNYLHTQGLFKNAKKIQFKLYSDIENPEYAQIFMNPKVRWNNYDKFLIGMRFHNQSLLTKPYKWYIEPKLSTGTGKLAGSASVQNTFTPRTTIFRSITLGVHSKFEHYDRDLSYLKWSVFADTNFKKDPRTALSHGVVLSFDHLDKEVPAFEIKTDEDRYALLNLTYYYSRPNYIHEFHGSATLQTTGVFQKMYGEAYYRWRFSPKKQLGIRLFAGTFIENQADTDYFNFGLSKTSDYAFNLNVLGRSENSGVLSQQYFLAEAGFKSMFEHTVNQWLVTSNVEVPVWKMFELYADVGVYKNKGQGAKFLYDTGVKVNFIPDFLSFYFPMQSTLGFEPGQKNYWEKIRFTFNMNLGSIINHLRRGWY